MSFIQRELDRIGDTLRANPDASDYDQLYAAQQALSWATDPESFKSPMKLLRGTRAETEGYSGAPHPLPS